MERARRHQRLLSALAFGLLALVAELLGRSLTHRLDFGRHVAPPSYAHADYYPILLAVVKVGIALLLVRLALEGRARTRRRAGRPAAGRRPRTAAASSGSPLSAAALPLVLPPHLGDLPRPGRRRGRGGRPLAAALAVAALVGAARLRGARACLRRRLEPPCAAGSPTTRSTRRRPSTARAAWLGRSPLHVPRPSLCSRSLRAASSASRSRAVRLRFLRNPPRA